MKYCSTDRRTPLLLLAACLLLGAVLTCLGIFVCIGVPFSPLLLIPFAVGLVMIALGLFSYIYLTREYAADAHGITLRYLGRFTATHPWNHVTSIVVCDLGNRLYDRTFPIVIRIAACREKCGPFQQPRCYNLFGGMDKWRTDPYQIRRFLSIALIDFSEDTLREIAGTSGREIKECWSNAARRNTAYRRMNPGE